MGEFRRHIVDLTQIMQIVFIGLGVRDRFFNIVDGFLVVSRLKAN